MKTEQIETAARHFCIAAAWADAQDGTRPRITKSAIDVSRKFVQSFVDAYPAECAAAMACTEYGAHPDAGNPAAAFGHDLFLTCAGHGAGFFDRNELGEIGATLSEHIRQEWRRWHVETDFYRGWMYVYAPAGRDQARAENPLSMDGRASSDNRP